MHFPNRRCIIRAAEIIIFHVLQVRRQLILNYFVKERCVIMKRSMTVVICLVCLLSGVFITAETKAAAKDGPVVEVYESRIELGVIPEDMSEVIGPVIISNKGTGDLQIVNVTGSCTCFKGYEGDKVIKPGEEGVIQVLYDKSKIPAGKVTRTATINPLSPLSDPLNSAPKHLSPKANS